MNNRLDIRSLESTALSSPYRYSHEGHSGGATVRGFVISNNSDEHVYTNLQASINLIADETIDSSTFFTNNGWRIKLITKYDDISLISVIKFSI